MVRVSAGERKMNDEFWKRKSLPEMSIEEWESLCDGCALCCLQKLEVDETGEVYFTDLACRLLDVETCRCCDYSARARKVSNCMILTADKPEAFRWLPATCAYRRLAGGQELPEWHPLITGDPESVHEADISARGKVISENESTQWTVLRKLGD